MPITPGSDGILESAEHGLELAREIGFPVMIKATAGGGGRGMRPCYEEDEFISLYDAASKEAIACFAAYAEDSCASVANSSPAASPHSRCKVIV